VVAASLRYAQEPARGRSERGGDPGALGGGDGAGGGGGGGAGGGGGGGDGRTWCGGFRAGSWSGAANGADPSASGGGHDAARAVREAGESSRRREHERSDRGGPLRCAALMDDDGWRWWLASWVGG